MKVIKTLLYFIYLNIIIFIFHIFAYFGIAFNDTSTFYASFKEALPLICRFFIPMIIASVLVIHFIFKKKDIYKSLLYFLQTVLIVIWVLLFTAYYVPQFFINDYFMNRQIELQENKNEQLIKEVKDYKIIDMIDNYTIYSNTKNMIIKYDKDYVKVKLKQVNKDTFDEIYHKLESDYTIGVNENNYRYTYYVTFDNKKWFELDKELFIYNVNVFDEYLKCVNKVMFKNKGYTPFDNFTHIEKKEHMLIISENTDDDTLVIMKDGKHLLSKALDKNKTFDLSEYDEGKYAVYLERYFENRFDSGYLISGNIVEWEN